MVDNVKDRVQNCPQFQDMTEEPTPRGNTTIYLLQTTDNATYVGRTTDLATRMESHCSKLGDGLTFYILGEYPSISIKGYGRLDARMEHLWYTRIQPDLNRVICGNNYYRRDRKRHKDALQHYEMLDKQYRKQTHNSL